jgi:hypothetical protein
LKKKRTLFAVLAFFLVYILWLGFLLLRFKPNKSSSEASPSEVEGVYHIHSRFSDGRSHPDKIIRLASLAHLDFIILTDHGKPNFDSLSCQGWKEGVLVLAGSELSVSRGHLVALGFKLPSTDFSQNTEQAVHEIAALGGFSIIAHPYAKVRWSWGEFVGYSGLELMNANTMLKKNFIFSLLYLPALLIKPEFFLLKILDDPSLNLKKWDELNNSHQVYGYFSTDAHVLYGPLFSLFHLHLLLERPLSPDFKTAKKEVYEALRRGKFYNAIDAASKAKGFKFWATNGNKITPMGETLFFNSPVTLEIEAPFPFAKEVHLLLNGKPILHSREKAVSFESSEPGTYRVEVYLRGKSPLARQIPWIVSNPIFLRKDKE